VKEQDVARLYRDYGYLVFRRCVVYLGDVPAARNATRDVFVRAVKNPSSLRAYADSRTWLCRVADQVCVALLKRRKAARLVAETEPDESALATVADDDHDSLLLTRRLLASLEPDELRMAVLFYVDEMSEEEIARELGLLRRTVAKRLAHLLEQARTLGLRKNAS
jgi:RNA polymerase sigma-70 factor, ECF subfamily